MNRRNFIAALASVPFISKAKPADKFTGIAFKDRKHFNDTYIDQSEHLRAIGEQIGIDQTNDMFKVLLLKGDE